MKQLNFEKRFADDLRSISGSTDLYGEILEYFCFNKYLPDCLDCIGMVGMNHSTYVVYRGHVSVDDAYLHKCYKVNEFYYIFTIYHGSVAVIAAKTCKCNYTQLSVTEFQRKITELPIHPDKETRKDFEDYNFLLEG